MHVGRILLSLLLLLVADPLAAEQPLLPGETAAALAGLQARRFELGLEARDDFRVLGAHRDDLGQSHVRFQQLCEGVPVFGGEAISHTGPGGEALPLTDALRRGVRVAVQPTLTAAEALALADADLRPAGPYAHPPTAERVIWPVPSGAPGYLLAYHVHTQLENGSAETRHTDYLFDAHSGALLKRWDSLRSEAAQGDGLTQYSGTVKLDLDCTDKGYELRDRTRGKGGEFGSNVITNLDHGSEGKGAVCFNPGSSWGDHANYTGDTLPTAGPTGQTAMADAAYGHQVAWDMFKHVFGRDGIDGSGRATYGRVHYGTSYDNAFWDDACFCMTYGDGKRFKSMEAVDVTGHELAHGVCSKSANLTYNGESGGLNEASSDIFGTMAKFYARGGGYQAGASSIPATGGSWTMGEQVSKKPLRYLYKPSKDGRSLDAWGPGIGDLDVHYSSGPMNRCFYFLSQGAAARAGERYTENLPAGMKGVGNQVAARIWYRTLTVYLTSQSDYAAARAAAIRAAGDLYGAGSLAEKAVRRAFHGINVGPDWSPVTAVILHPVADQVIFTGTTLAFEGSARDSAPGARLDYGWVFGDGGVAVGASASHTYRNNGLLDLVCPATFDVLDDQGNLGSDTRTITVTASVAARPERVRNGGFEDGSTGWEGDTQVIGAFQEHPPYAGQRNVLFTGVGYPSVQKLSQSVAIPAPVGSATLSFRLRIDTDQLLAVPLDYLRVQLLTGSGQLVQELAAYSNLDASPDYVLKTIDLSGLQGRALRLNFQANEGWVFKTSFALDDVSLIVR